MAHDGVKTFYMHASAFFHQLSVLLLGSERKQQLRISRSLTAAFVFLACIGLQVYAYWHGFMEVQYVWRLSIVIVVNIVFWYALLRSGLNLRFRDPALTLPQVLAALTIIVYAYSVTGRIHGSIMMLLTLVQVFGIFNMSQRDSRLAGLYSLGLMGCAMVYKTQTDPTNYPYQVEIAHFILIAAILPTISSLTAQLNNMRTRLQSQKNELAQALTRIQILATRDELTGLFNRRHMLDVLTQHQKRLIRSGHHRFCLALLDIDHFKRINDTHGHGVGDLLLIEVAERLKTCVREADTVARFGGDEFVVLLCELDTQHHEATAQAAAIAEKIRARLAEPYLLQATPSAPAIGHQCTASIGVAVFHGRDESQGSVIDRADAAMYQAKEDGRNRIRFASGSAVAA